MMKQVSSKTPIDFLLYIGDEVENEPAFEYLNPLQGKRSKYIDSNACIYTCTIGMKATQANYFLSTPETASTVFEHLSQSIRRRHIRSRRI